MKRLPTTAAVLSATLALTASSRAVAAEIAVDCGDVVARGRGPLKYGVCVNYLIDSDKYDPKRKHRIRESLKKLGVKAIRWNEGEIGDKMIWAIPPFREPDAHVTHQRTPGTVHYNWRVDARGKPPKVMELDEAIAVARDMELELYIIVGIDAIWVEEPGVRARDTSGKADELGTVHKRMGDYPWAIPGKTARETIVAGTEALARYLAAHAVDVEVFLEIGNENYLGDANWKPERYAELVNVLSRKIRRANPEARVGAQLAHQFKWTSVSADGRGWNEVLREKLDFERLDHLVAHQYGYWETRNLDSAVAFLESLPRTHRRRLEITVTETGTWHLPGTKERWSPNDLRRSLYQFRWLGLIQLKGKGRLRTPLFWTTRWLDAIKKGAYEKSFNALNMAGELAPSGHAIRIWNDFVHDSLVTTTIARAPKDMQCYASVDTRQPEVLTVWLVNNHKDERPATVRLKSYRGRGPSAMYVYTGKGPEDKYPRLERAARPPALKRTTPPSLECRMPPYSITVLEFGGAPARR
jgi:hypothetical protein